MSDDQWREKDELILIAGVPILTQTAVAHIAEHHANDDPYVTFAHIEQTAYQFAGEPAPLWQHPTMPDQPPPRLTEDWFC